MKSKRWIVLLMLLLSTCSTPMTLTVQGDDNKGHLTVGTGKVLDGIYYAPMYVDNEVSYCLESSKDSPLEAWYELNEELLSPEQSLLAKVMYYAYGNPGYEPSLWIWDCPDDNDRAYLRSHMVLSMIYNPDHTLKREVHSSSWVPWWEEYIAGRIAVMKMLPAPPAAALSLSESDLEGYLDKENQIKRTKEITLNGAVENQVKVPLPADIVLVNVTQGTEKSGEVVIRGGDRFYLKTAVDKYFDKSWSTGKLSGSVQNEYLTCVVSTSPSGDTQDVGRCLVVSPQDTVGFSVHWNPYGRIRVQKQSQDEKATADGIDDEYYSLAGAQFEIRDKQNKTADVVTTDSNGNAVTSWLSLGEYTVTEVKNPQGYLKASDRSAALEKLEVKVVIEEVPQYGKIKLKKVDSESNDGSPQGNGSIEGARYRLSNSAGEEIEQKDTDEKGELVFEGLPLGKYTIEETDASKGYLKDLVQYTVDITSENSTEEVFVHEVTSKEQTIRGDLELIKIEDVTMVRLSGIPFKITSVTTNESHIILTDENGYASTSSQWNLHSNNTNRGEQAEDGVWFGEISALDDEKGALIYDKYLIEELSCEANQEFELIPPFEITISRDNYTVDLGTVTNKRLDLPFISIGTKARDKESGTQIVEEGTEVTIVDEVEYTNLSEGKEYTVKGILMDKETGEPLLINGNTITSEKSFIAEKRNGVVALEFSFDASGLKGRTIVVFEKLYMDGEEVAAHEDIDDREQTVEIVEKKGVLKQAVIPMTADDNKSVFWFLIMTAALTTIIAAIGGLRIK